MMVALLRQGARRIGGSMLQRTQAAVTSPALAEERRRLMPRRMATDSRPSAQEIQQKKEELYEVLSKVENFRNRRLLLDLALHIEPRPEDTQWRRLRVGRRISDFGEITGAAMFVSFAVALNSGVCSSQAVKMEGKSGGEVGCNGEEKSIGDSDGEASMTEINILKL